LYSTYGISEKEDAQVQDVAEYIYGREMHKRRMWNGMLIGGNGSGKASAIHELSWRTRGKQDVYYVYGTCRV
jgi:hypothetical protein